MFLSYDTHITTNSLIPGERWSMTFSAWDMDNYPAQRSFYLEGHGPCSIILGPNELPDRLTILTGDDFTSRAEAWGSG